MVKTIQIEAYRTHDCIVNNQLLRAAGVKRIHNGWYTVWYNGVSCDCSTVTRAKRNTYGEIE